MTRAILGLGSNLGARWSELSRAVLALQEIDPKLVVSSIYETAPVGGPKDQGRFLNCAVALDWTASPPELLEFAHQLERDAHRVRIERWGPRTLDVDVLWIDGYESDDPVLTVPHPRMFDRAFVLVPVSEVAPDVIGDGWRHHLGLDGTSESVISRVGVLVSSMRE